MAVQKLWSINSIPPVIKYFTQHHFTSHWHTDPKDPCMIYIYLYLADLYGKCREIYIVPPGISIFLPELCFHSPLPLRVWKVSHIQGFPIECSSDEPWHELSDTALTPRSLITSLSPAGNSDELLCVFPFFFVFFVWAFWEFNEPCCPYLKFCYWKNQKTHAVLEEMEGL